MGTVVFVPFGGACVVCCLLHYSIQVFCNNNIFLFNSIRDLLTDHAWTSIGCRGKKNLKVYFCTWKVHFCTLKDTFVCKCILYFATMLALNCIEKYSKERKNSYQIYFLNADLLASWGGSRKAPGSGSRFPELILGTRIPDPRHCSGFKKVASMRFRRFWCLMGSKGL